ncbi:MAG: hypothetical protein M3365_04170 [Gemmatimonadota bacterium]|nr:hypothetical protein [Gemmatimonadota bacterium]
MHTTEVSVPTQTRVTPSGEPSGWLRFVAWFFKLAGFLFVFIALIALVGLVLDVSPPPGYPSHAITLLLVSGIAAALLATGFLLARRSRAGAWIALALNLYPWAFVLTGARPLSWIDIVVTVVTVAVIWRIWPELSSRNTSTPAR